MGLGHVPDQAEPESPPWGLDLMGVTPAIEGIEDALALRLREARPPVLEQKRKLELLEAARAAGGFRGPSEPMGPRGNPPSFR